VEGEKVPQHCSGLLPSDKELPEWRSVTKIPLVVIKVFHNVPIYSRTCIPVFKQVTCGPLCKHTEIFHFSHTPSASLSHQDPLLLLV
jgi:hypothetical protein